MQDAVDGGDLGSGGTCAIASNEGEGALEGDDVPRLSRKWRESDRGPVFLARASQQLAEVGVGASVEKLLDATQGHASGLEDTDGGELQEVAFDIAAVSRLGAIEEAEGAIVAEAALREIFGSLSADGDKAAFGTPLVHGLGEFREVFVGR